MHVLIQKKLGVREFKVPKFKMTFEFDASEALKVTGLELPFSNSAELDEKVLDLKPDQRLKVSKLNIERGRNRSCHG